MSLHTARLVQEQNVVSDKFPPGTRMVETGGVVGWMYKVESEFGDPYTLFAFWNGSQYRVKMVLPEPESFDVPHVSHYFENGDICLVPGIGLPTMEAAYAKSILFINAWSVLQRTGEFAF
jgi:hypothetical protein